MKSLRILVPLAVLSCSLTGCNGGAGVHTRLNRDNYKALDNQTADDIDIQAVMNEYPEKK